MEKLEKVKKEILSCIEGSDSIDELRVIKKDYLGKKGKISELFKLVAKAPEEERSELGKKVNEIRDILEERVKKKENALKILEEEGKGSSFDPTLPGEVPVLGNRHPLSRVSGDLIRIFEKMGFSAIEGPDMESVWYNFDALNFPEEHPAREMQDTLFVKQSSFSGSEKHNISSKERKVMRTHTSPVQIRHMEENEPPLRIIVPGRVYRNETTDATHEINFYQLEGLMVDEGISVANFKAIITDFINQFFKGDVGVRLRPSFFPFTEPSFEVDMSCTVCSGKGCSVCSNTGWVEVLGAGMVHPNVMKNSGLDSEKWQGFAFGMGVDRLAMIKYGIDDVRLFYGGDLRFLKQFY